MPDVLINRAFVRLADGLVHCRRAEGNAAQMPLLMLHASPGSSLGLEPLMRALATTGQAPILIAPDTLGHGDSAPSTVAEPDIATYAKATILLLDALGIDKVAIYGAHTGARIACEAGVLHPDRISHVIVDGIGEYAADRQADLLARYAPEMVPDDYGTQMIWAFQFVRDQALHFPHYERDPAHRLMSRPVPDAQALHIAALEVLKALGTYHHAYRAAFRYPTSKRLELLKRPLVLLDADNELPALRNNAKALVAAAPEVRSISIGSTPGAKAAAILSVVTAR